MAGITFPNPTANLAVRLKKRLFVVSLFESTLVKLGKSPKPTGRHLAPAKSPIPLTEIAQVVASGQLQRRAAVVATAGGLFMSSFAAANLDFAGSDSADDAYLDAGLAENNDAAALTEAADLEEFIAALPGWVVEPAALTVAGSVTYEEAALPVVEVTPAPPPPPVARVNRAAVGQAPPASVAGNAVLEVAARFVGTPYQHGGATPAAFDCSGFTQYVFAQVGIRLPRTSSTQRHAGTVISRADAQPGDLVWWPGHVGIFVEGNTFIDAAGPGRTVQFREMWNSNPTFIRL